MQVFTSPWDCRESGFCACFKGDPPRLVYCVVMFRYPTERRLLGLFWNLSFSSTKFKPGMLVKNAVSRDTGKTVSYDSGRDFSCRIFQMSITRVAQHLLAHACDNRGKVINIYWYGTRLKSSTRRLRDWHNLGLTLFKQCSFRSWCFTMPSTRKWNFRSNSSWFFHKIYDVFEKSNRKSRVPKLNCSGYLPMRRVRTKTFAW